MMAPMTGALDGVTVLDLSWGVAGPIATMLLADNGARVTRIEPPGGDPFACQSGYAVWQRGKRSAVIDLRDPAGRRALRRLAAAADVVVEAFAPGTLARLGIGYEALAAENPGLIWCSITGYGTGNRHEGRPAYDGLVSARTGLVWDQRGRWGSAMFRIAGHPPPHPDLRPPEGMVRGAPRPGPLFPRSTWPSLAAGLLAALGVAAALRAREVTGRGQRVETSLLQGALCAAVLTWQRVERPGAPMYWTWSADGRSVDGLFECADGRWVHHWAMRPAWVLGAAAGEVLRPPPLEHAYRDDPDRLGTEPDDMLAAHFLYPLLAGAFRRFPAAEWVDAAARVGVGVAPVRSPAEALADPSLAAGGFVVEVDHPRHGRIRHVGAVIGLSRTPGRSAGPCAEPGEHTAAVLAEAATARPAPARPASGSLTSPLAGIRVIDVGLGVAGPFAARLLADLGADVVKVHAPHDTWWAGTHMGLATNRGKRSVALDLHDPRGLAVLHRLLDGADVLVSNWRPAASRRLGLDYASLAGRHPRLVCCNIAGYEPGPRAGLPGTDQTASALCGVEWEDGACHAGNPPLWSRLMMGDTGAGLLAAIGVVFALCERERSGRGQEVTTSLVQACLLTTSYAWVRADGTPGPWERVDAGGYGLGPTYRLFETADGWVFVAAVTADHRRRLCRAIGRPDLDAEPAERLAAGVAEALARRTTAEAATLLDGAGVPAEVVDESFCRAVFDDEDLRARRWVAATASAHVGRFEDPGLLVDLSATPGVIQRGPCACGEHSREVLTEAGLSAAEIDELVAAGVVVEAARGARTGP
jgi:crotonobetainyl-CoA:carnitine CoA-transferase CaiB-like acyl-CoA transferase